MAQKWGPFILSIAAAIVLAIMAVMPPGPQSADIALDQFSSGRAMKDVRIIAEKPHPTGSDENEKVRNYLMGRLKELGLNPKVHKAPVPDYALERLNKWSGQDTKSMEMFNITAIMPGKDRTKPALLLMSHHDTVWDSPGASDDTMGVATIFEIARIVKDMERERDLIILFTDAEEPGLAGAEHFFRQNPLSDKIGAVINFESRGAGGTANLFQLSEGDGQAIKAYNRSAADPSATSLSVYVYNRLPNDTDMTHALEKDYIAYNFAVIGKAGLYHSPLIDADALSEGSLQHMGVQGLGLTQALLSADTLPERSSNIVFFDLFGLFMIAYAPFWGWIFIAIGIAAYALSVGKSVNSKEILGGAARMLTFVIVGGFLLWGLNWISGNVRGANYYDRLAAIPSLEVVALFASLAMFFIIIGSKTFSKGERLGVALPIILLAIAGQAMAPTATYFISLSVMLAGTASLMAAKWDNRLRQAIIAISTILVVGYMFGLAHLLLVGVGDFMLPVAILPAAIATMILASSFPGLSKSVARKLAISALIVAIVIALWVRLDPLADTVATYSIR